MRGESNPTSHFSNTLREGLQQFFASTGNIIKDAFKSNSFREVKDQDSFPADRMATKQSGLEIENQIEEIEGSIEPYHDSFFEKS